MIQPQPFVLAETYLSWIPAFSREGFVAMVLVAAVLWLCLRLFWGKSLVRGRIGLWILRGCSLAILSAILLGPTMVHEQEGEITRPSMMFLLDGSQSMKLGQEASRWDESLEFLADAKRLAGDLDSANCQSFRFGHRLAPLAQQQAVKVVSTSSGDAVIAPPDASDSRLGDALRQLLPQVSAKSSAGVVLFSDGRVRASETVERLAEYFGDSNVPIHVVPVGEATGTGDIAVVSLVVPSRVRKYTENELQVFLRSFGLTGSRTNIHVKRKQSLGEGESAVLASTPVTLSGGAQSVQMKFRVDERPEDLEIVIDPIEGELTTRNNRVETRVEIDRTKVRVLYVDTDTTPRMGIFGNLFGNSTTRTDTGNVASVQNALQADKDVECTALVSVGGSAPTLVSNQTTQAASGFPRTRAELFAYDCVVLSNVGPDVLTQEQVSWLAQWIEGRGGGLIVAGGRALLPSSWKGTPLEPMLPISLEKSSPAIASEKQVQVAMPKHPIWRLRLEELVNRELLSQLPTLQIGSAGGVPKPTADILAVDASDDTAVMMSHRVGRGRVLVSTAALGGNAVTKLAEKWGPQPERLAAKFWRNMVYWATEGSLTGRRRLIAESDKRFYRPGEPLKIVAKAYDEGARRTQKYRVWAMFEPSSLDDMSMYSPLLWPDNVVRESGEVGPRIFWGEEMKLTKLPSGDGYEMNLMLSETDGVGDSGLRIEMTAYEGEESEAAYDHGTQVDSTSLAIQILSDPFEQQNPLPNHELMARLASVSGGEVLDSPDALANLLQSRSKTHGPPTRDSAPAWSKWWLWLCLLGLLSAEWVWRRVTGLA